MARNLSLIAKDIKNAWPNVNFAAKPYLDAMLQIDSPEMDACYYADDAKTIVIYFLCNASSFRGAQARELKKELKTQYKIN